MHNFHMYMRQETQSTSSIKLSLIYMCQVDLKLAFIGWDIFGEADCFKQQYRQNEGSWSSTVLDFDAGQHHKQFPIARIHRF